MTSSDPDLAPLTEPSSRWRRGTWRDFPPNRSCEWTPVVHRIRVYGERYRLNGVGEWRTSWMVDGIAVVNGELWITELMWECSTWAEAIGKVEDAGYVFQHVLDHQPRPLPLTPA